ncbi:MAG: YicC/YloC family endoribonuclease [Bacteroidota bacterium]
MALSMTGFGRGIFANELFAIRIELRAVNHRYLEISLRLPRSLGQFEDRLRRLIGTRLSRGKVDVSCHFEVLGAEGTRVRLDKGLAIGYHNALQELAALFGLPGEYRLDSFMQLPDLFLTEPVDFDQELLWEGISQALASGLAELTAMRRAEGEKLVRDLVERVDTVAMHTDAIEGRAPLVPETYRAQLQRRLSEVLGQAAVDEVRLAQEVALFADRCSITEELVRLRSHLSQLRSTLLMEGALGRKADFILQEITREINTIGAKANDLTIAQAVIEVKTELEKIREQVQNLE